MTVPKRGTLNVTEGNLTKPKENATLRNSHLTCHRDLPVWIGEDVVSKNAIVISIDVDLLQLALKQESRSAI